MRFWVQINPLSLPGYSFLNCDPPSPPPSFRLLVLDEMDQLDSKSQEVLYTIFEWPYLAGSRLCLVGKTSGPT